MTLIFDTSPICFLVLIGEIEILPRLATEILVPPGVVDELNHPKSPALVREWVQRQPPWLEVHNVDPTLAASFDFLTRAGGQARTARSALSLGATAEDSLSRQPDIDQDNLGAS